MRKKLTISLIIIALLAFAGCSSQNNEGTDAAKASMPSVTNMAGSTTASEVCDTLNDAGLSNVAVFNDWVLDFAGSAGKDSRLTDKWVQPGDNNPDLAACADGWEICTVR